MKKLLRLLKNYKKECVLAPLFKMLEALFELFVPLVMAAIIDTGVESGDTPFISKCAILLVALGVIGLVCSLTAQYFSARAAVGFAAKIRHALFSHIQELSYSDLDGLGTSTMINRLTSDVNQVQNGVNLVLRLAMRSPFVVFGAMIMAFTVDAQGALTFVVVIPLLAIVVFGVMLATIPLFKKVQGKLDVVMRRTRENLTGVRVIRAFHQEEAQTEAFAEDTKELLKAQIFTGRITALMNPLTMVIVNAGILALLWTGAVKVNGGFLTAGAVIALVNYMSQILIELVKLANLIITVTKAWACGDRIQAVLEKPSSMPAENITPCVGDGSVSFENVSLTYPNAAEQTLYPFSLTVEAGETVGIIGGTGSGKSSLVNLIPRLYDATSGRVLVNGTDVREQDVETLRGMIGIVPQHAALLKGTVRSNLLWGNPDADDEQLWNALEMAQAKGFVAEKDGGLDAPVSQGGKNFSGGQKQRLTIARALVRQPRVLILDDASSALDYMTDAALRKAIAALTPRPTTFIVSQRTASLQNADKIVVLEDGEVVAVGVHKELLQTCDVYREIHLSQYPEEVTE